MQPRQSLEYGTANSTNDALGSKVGLVENIKEYCTRYPSRSLKPDDDAVPLSKYIDRAERCHFGKSMSGWPIFSQSTHVSTEPTLRKGRPNRVIAFAGCFNPPHLGHLELLAHVFLRTDRCTVGAMLIPVGDTLPGKHGATFKGKAFELTKADRAALLQDELLSRFSWVFKGTRKDVPKFQQTTIREAQEDGYQLSFTSLTGSDHNSSVQCAGHSGWGSGSSITSDITRPSEWLDDTGAQPRALDDCGPWKKILPAKSVRYKGYVHCWPCWKFQAMCPELQNPNGLSAVYPIVNMTHESTPASHSFFGGIASEILHRCHETDGTTWLCHRDDDEVLWFFPSGRQYPVDTRRTDISSTFIRKTLDETHEDDLYDTIKTITMNPRELLRILFPKKAPKVDDSRDKEVSEEDIELESWSMVVHTGEGPRESPSMTSFARSKDDGYVGMNTETALQRFKRRRLTM